MTDATIWMNPKNMLSKRSQMQRFYIFYFIYMKRQMFRNQNQISNSLRLGENGDSLQTGRKVLLGIMGHSTTEF